VAALFTAGLAAALVPLLSRDQEARFWALGMVLALLPIAATFPSNRLLFFAGLGSMALLARLLSTIFPDGSPAAAGRASGRGLARGFALLMVLTHLVIAPLGMPVNAYLTKVMGEPIVRAAATLPADQALTGQDLIFVNAPDFLLYVSYMPSLMLLENRPLPLHIRALSAGPAPTELRREDARTLVLRAEGGMLTGPLGRLFRGPTLPMRAGDRVDLTGVTVETIRVTGDGRPLEVRFRFSVPLEDASLRWVRWEKDGFVPMELPPIGKTVTLAPAHGPMDL
jgi:hypothetical protein